MQKLNIAAGVPPRVVPRARASLWLMPILEDLQFTSYNDTLYVVTLY